eukprot:jgi/Picsp_1/1720/NSC_05193-R1_---NA---
MTIYLWRTSVSNPRRFSPLFCSREGNFFLGSRHLPKGLARSAIVRSKWNSKIEINRRQVIKYARYGTLVGKAFGFDPLSLLLPAVLTLGALVGFVGVSVGTLIFLLSILGSLIVSFAVFLSLGWIIFPVVAVLCSITVLLSGGLVSLFVVGSFLALGFYATRTILSKVDIEDETLSSLSDDFSEWELKRFDEKLKGK